MEKLKKSRLARVGTGGLDARNSTFSSSGGALDILGAAIFPSPPPVRGRGSQSLGDAWRSAKVRRFHGDSFLPPKLTNRVSWLLFYVFLANVRLLFSSLWSSAVVFAFLSIGWGPRNLRGSRCSGFNFFRSRRLAADSFPTTWSGGEYFFVPDPTQISQWILGSWIFLFLKSSNFVKNFFKLVLGLTHDSKSLPCKFHLRKLCGRLLGASNILLPYWFSNPGIHCQYHWRYGRCTQVLLSKSWHLDAKSSIL